MREWREGYSETGNNFEMALADSHIPRKIAGMIVQLSAKIAGIMIKTYLQEK